MVVECRNLTNAVRTRHSNLSAAAEFFSRDVLRTTKMANDAYGDPISAVPVDGAVVIIHAKAPLSAALTPEAALESARLLTVAARRVLAGDFEGLGLDE